MNWPQIKADGNIKVEIKKRKKKEEIFRGFALSLLFWSNPELLDGNKMTSTTCFFFLI